MRDLNELKQLQSLPLAVKIQKTQKRLEEWIDTFGVDGVYISFSGGKDSTVLLHIARQMYPRIKAVFSDTGLEYPEVREFVKSFDNVDWVKPKMTFRQVIEKYGYPFISKEVAQTVYEVKRRIMRGGQGTRYRLKKLNGEAVDKKTGKPSQYNIPKWKFLVDAPFVVSHMCCNTMKKAPVKKYEDETGRKPITGQMASESRLRTTQWLQHGCNAFEKKRQISNPMSFWTEQDVLLYIYMQKLPIASVYGDVVIDYAKMGQIENQMNLADFGVFDLERPLLRTTGCDRTGCMFCGYGCHLEKSPGRFERMKETHPNIYDYIMKDWEEGGLGYKKIIDWINENGNLDIKY